MLERQYEARFAREQSREMRNLEWERDEYAVARPFMNAIRSLVSRVLNWTS